MTDFAKTDEDRAILKLFSTDVVIGRPFVTSPGVPAERVALLRKAFDDMMKDPAYLEGRRARPVSTSARSTGEKIQKIVADLVHTPDDIVAKAKLAMEPKDTIERDRNEETPSDDRDRGLRSFPRLPRRRGAGGRHRAHLADAGAARDLRALHLQPRMGRERTVVREILDPGDAQEPRHHRAADRVLAALPVLGLLRQQEEQDQNRRATSRARRSARPNGRTPRPSTCAAGSTTSTASSSRTSIGIRPAPTSPGAPRRSS